MKLVLINPPTTSPFAPTMGIIALKGYLQQSGIDVVQVDASIEALHHLLSPARIDRDLLPGVKKFHEELSDVQRSEIMQNRFTGAEPFCSGNPMEAIRRRVTDSWTETGFRIDRNHFEKPAARP